MKKIIGLILVLILVSSGMVLAQEDCNWWCEFKGWMFGTGGEETALVGKAGGIWGGEEALVGEAIRKMKIGGKDVPVPTGAEHYIILSKDISMWGKKGDVIFFNERNGKLDYSKDDGKWREHSDGYKDIKEAAIYLESTANEIPPPPKEKPEAASKPATGTSEGAADTRTPLTAADFKNTDRVKQLRGDGISGSFKEQEGKFILKKDEKGDKEQLYFVDSEGKEHFVKQSDLSKTSVSGSSGAAAGSGSLDPLSPLSDFGEDWELSRATAAGYRSQARAAEREANKLRDERREKEDELEGLDAKKDKTKIKKLTNEIKNLNDKEKSLRKEVTKAESDAKGWEEKAKNERWGGDYFTEKMGANMIYFDGENPLGYGVQGFAATSEHAGNYKGLSSLLVPEATKKWQDLTNHKFFEVMDVVGAVTKKWCDYDDWRTADIPGQNAVFIETVSGTYQLVGSIMAERSAEKTFVLCHPINETCPGDLVCKDDLCYETEEAEEPVMGYMYKIDWGVTAPQDEKQTPYIDENGKAVKFNVGLWKNYGKNGGEGKGTGNYKYLYQASSGTIADEVIQLDNGEQDSGLRVVYYPEAYDAACVDFSSRSYPVDRYERNKIGMMCAQIKVATQKAVRFDIGLPSVKVSTGEVSETNDW